MTNSDRESLKNKTRFKASRAHQGQGHWHVDVRSDVFVCKTCKAKIPKHLDPQYCPECESGKEASAMDSF